MLECSLYGAVYSSVIVFITSLFPRYFNDTPVAVYNCDTVEVVGSEFLNNTAHGTLVDLPFRTNAGGIAYTSVERPQSVRSSLVITDCVFKNNSAHQSVAESRDPTQSRVRSIFTGRGGGVGAAFGLAENVDILVENCSFTGNAADVFGGGLYINTISGATHNHYTINNCTFVENVASLGGGGISLTFTPNGSPNTTNRMELKRTTFVRNVAGLSGGALYLFPGTYSMLPNDDLILQRHH